MENKKVIQVKDLTKMYKLYDKPSDRLKEALGLTRKKLYKEHYALHDVNFVFMKENAWELSEPTVPVNPRS